MLLAGCTASGSGASTSPPATTSGLTTPSQSPTPTPESVVLATYSAFWKALPQASYMTGAPREAVLTRYLVNPALSKVSGTLAAADAFHRAVYGQVVLRPLAVSVTGTQAEVKDCQDTSDSGIVDLKTGNKVTVGIPRALVITTLVYAGDSWRIATIDYQGPKC